MRFIITIAFAALCPAAELPVSADAHTYATLPSNNFGALQQLAVGAGSHALLQFDMSGLSVPTDPNTVAKATLVVFVNRVAQVGRLDAAPIMSPWTELAVSGALLPNIGAAIATSNDISQPNQYVRLDVTN